MSGGSKQSVRMAMDVLELNFLTVQLADQSINDIKKRDCEEVCENLRIITLEQLSRHDRHDDCWIAVYDRVYDCTAFIGKHPGGQDVILEYAGRDATLAFVDSGHSVEANRILRDYLIGQLPPHERLWLPNRIKVNRN
ncbi:cytochrome b5 [Fopius arisanus]|uniref:CYB5_0 protein n=1 Tax=Fopius arisanus TaxID=64838 RepID=A0A0C9QGC3_9HYME|nr:PREDICTED: cytochrome b5 [Fopius arisanus]